MANGSIKQFRGPFDPNTTIDLGSSVNCRIGISVGQDDFMSWCPSQASTTEPHDIKFIINGSTIHLGRTYMYQTGQQINNTQLIFPEGAPDSTKVQVVYCDQNNSQQEEDEG